MWCVLVCGVCKPCVCGVHAVFVHVCVGGCARVCGCVCGGGVHALWCGDLSVCMPCGVVI